MRRYPSSDTTKPDPDPSAVPSGRASDLRAGLELERCRCRCRWLRFAMEVTKATEGPTARKTSTTVLSSAPRPRSASISEDRTPKDPPPEEDEEDEARYVAEQSNAERPRRENALCAGPSWKAAAEPEPEPDADADADAESASDADATAKARMGRQTRRFMVFRVGYLRCVALISGLFQI